MNKDTVVASTIGFGMGLIAAIALWVAPRMLPRLTSTQTPLQPSAATEQVESAVDAKTDELLVITNPNDGDIVTTETINVTGKARQSNQVIVTTPDLNQIVIPNADGTFSANVSLTEGVNNIAVVVQHESEITLKQMQIFYYLDGI